MQASVCNCRKYFSQLQNAPPNLLVETVSCVQESLVTTFNGGVNFPAGILIMAVQQKFFPISFLRGRDSSGGAYPLKPRDEQYVQLLERM